MREATQKMIEYAKGISLTLDIPLDNYEFDYIHSFISEHKQQYRYKIRQYDNKELIDFITKQYTKAGFEIAESFIYELNKYKEKCGVYILWSEKTLVYIGKSQTLTSRVLGSIKERNTKEFPVTDISIIPTPTIADMHILEPLLIIENKPLLNNEFNCEESSIMFKSNINIYDLEKLRSIEE